MTTSARTVSPANAPSDVGTIYRLADHLDATLAMGEDLLRLACDVPLLQAGQGTAEINQRHASLVRFARATRAIELGITARLLQARARAIEIRHTHARFTPLIGLFVGGTAPLADAAAERGLGDISETALAGGPDVRLFLIGRGLIAADTPSLSAITSLNVTENYLLAERIPLGVLLDMVAQFLETLDLAFDLYAEPRVGVERAHD